MKYDICDITFFAIAETQIPRDLTLRFTQVEHQNSSELCHEYSDVTTLLQRVQGDQY